jgi:protein-S-isoprenylcysteine O-methyltransferase Ste14
VEKGLVGAFFISLFVEMYGIPLTILFASKHFFTATNLPKDIVEFDFLGVGFSMDVSMAYGAVLMVIGAFLVILGWITLYRNIKKGFVTTGIYSFSRHPQYLGFILVNIGWIFGWPTIITLVFAPILIYKYISVCKKEELEVSKEFPRYKDYKKTVPFFI